MDDSSSTATHSNATYSKADFLKLKNKQAKEKNIKNSMDIWDSNYTNEQTNMINYWRSARTLLSGCPHVSPEWMPCVVTLEVSTNISWLMRWALEHLCAKLHMDVAMNVGQNVQTLNISAKYEKQLLHFDLAKVEKEKNCLSFIFRPNSIFSRAQNFTSLRIPSAFIFRPVDANKD